MTFDATVTADELAEMRATSTSALPDTGAFTRPGTGQGTIDNDGNYTPPAATPVYSGAMRLRAPSAEEWTRVFGDTEVTEQRFMVTLPWDAPEVQIDDVGVISVGSDPHIGTRSFRVTRVPAGSWLIDRRLGVEEIT